MLRIQGGFLDPKKTQLSLVGHGGCSYTTLHWIYTVLHVHSVAFHWSSVAFARIVLLHIDHRSTFAAIFLHFILKVGVGAGGCCRESTVMDGAHKMRDAGGDAEFSNRW